MNWNAIVPWINGHESMSAKDVCKLHKDMAARMDLFIKVQAYEACLSWGNGIIASVWINSWDICLQKGMLNICYGRCAFSTVLKTPRHSKGTPKGLPKLNWFTRGGKSWYMQLSTALWYHQSITCYILLQFAWELRLCFWRAPSKNRYGPSHGIKKRRNVLMMVYLF